MPFQPGNQLASCAARKNSRIVSDHLRRLLAMDADGKKKVGFPKKGLYAHTLAVVLLNKALAGELDAVKEVMIRVEGRPPQIDMGEAWDQPPDQPQDMSLRELARIVGFILTSQVPRDQVQLPAS